MQHSTTCAIVLAGGYATRLYPLTLNKPKPLLPVAGKPIIDYVIDLIRQVNPDTTVISTNKRFKPEFDTWATTTPIKVKVVAEETLREEEKPGAVKALHQLLQQYTGYDTYIVIGGDNLMTLNLKEMLELHNRTGSPVIAAYTLKDPREASRYGVIESTINGTITTLVEKPKLPKSNLIATCCYILPAHTPKLLQEYLEKGGKPDAPGYFIEWLVKKTKTLAYKFKGTWFDIGTPEAYLKANLTLITHSISPKAEVSSSEAVESIVEEKAKLNKSLIVSSYIGHSTAVENSTVKKSVILPKAKVEDSTVSNSIIGENSVIKAHRLKKAYLPDHTKIGT